MTQSACVSVTVPILFFFPVDSRDSRPSLLSSMTSSLAVIGDGTVLVFGVVTNTGSTENNRSGLPSSSCRERGFW